MYTSSALYRCDVRNSPLQVKAQVFEYAAAGQEGAAHAGKQLPVSELRILRLDMRVGDAGLFDKLAVEFISERPEVEAGLEDPLYERNGLAGRLQLLEAVKKPHRLFTDGHVAFTCHIYEEK